MCCFKCCLIRQCRNYSLFRVISHFTYYHYHIMCSVIFETESIFSVCFVGLQKHTVVIFFYHGREIIINTFVFTKCIQNRLEVGHLSLWEDELNICSSDIWKNLKVNSFVTLCFSVLFFVAFNIKKSCNFLRLQKFFSKSSPLNFHILPTIHPRARMGILQVWCVCVSELLWYPLRPVQ